MGLVGFGNLNNHSLQLCWAEKHKNNGFRSCQKYNSTATLDTDSPKANRRICHLFMFSHFSLFRFLSPVCSYFSLPRFLSLLCLCHISFTLICFFASSLSHPQYTECLWEAGTESLHKPLDTVNSVRVPNARLSTKPSWHLHSHAVFCSVWNYRLIILPLRSFPTAEQDKTHCRANSFFS